MGERTLYLIRHGQYATDPERLTDLGRAQCEVLASRLRHVRFDAVHSSSLPRAVESAAPLRRDHPDAPGLTSRHLREGIPVVPRRKPELGTDAVVLQKSAARLGKAMTRFCRPTRGPDRVEALVFHGNFIRAMICQVMDLEPTAWLDLQIHNASLSVVRIRKDGNRLVSFNDTGHLPPPMVTEG